MLDIKKAVTLDTFVRELANVDKDVARVSSKIEMFLDKGELQRIAIQISWDAKDHYYILDGDMNLILHESYDAFSNLHPKLGDIIDKFLGDSLRKEKAIDFEKRRITYEQKNKLFNRPLFSLKKANII